MTSRHGQTSSARIRTWKKCQNVRRVVIIRLTRWALLQLAPFLHISFEVMQTQMKPLPVGLALAVMSVIVGACSMPAPKQHRQSELPNSYHVQGEVKKPGYFDCHPGRERTLVELISMAGDF